MKIYAETERLILREIELTDIDAMFELDSDPLVRRYIDNKPAESKDEVLESIKYIRSQYETHGIGRWLAVEKSTGDIIGWSGLKFNTGKKEELNGRQDFYDIGYRFIPRYWGKGYATESSIAALDYGFQVKQYSVIDGIALIDNIASNKVLQKIGLKHITDFKYEDTIACWYALNREDYAKKMS